MKKLLILLSLFLLTCGKGYCALTIQSVGGTTVNTTSISTPIQASISALIAITLNMKVTCLDQFITNTSDSSIQIPVSQLYLNDGINEFQMQYNTPITTISGLSISIGTYNKNYNCIVKNIGVLPPGSYTTRLKFETLNLLLPLDTITFNLNFTIPVVQDLTNATNPVNITLFPDTVFDGNAVIDNTITPQIIIKSNDKWKLIMDTTGLGTLQGNYYFTITEVSPNVTNYINTQTQLQSNQQYVLASGNATVSKPIYGSYVTDFIKLKYTLKNTSGTYITEGIYNNYATYKIQQGN